MEIKRISPLAFAKVQAIMMAIIGLIFGLFVALLGGFAGSLSPQPGVGITLGASAIILLPIFYGILGFLMGLIGAGIYNLVASWVGGFEIDLVKKK
jgi:hypothetical protein